MIECIMGISADTLVLIDCSSKVSIGSKFIQKLVFLIFFLLKGGSMMCATSGKSASLFSCYLKQGVN